MINECDRHTLDWEPHLIGYEVAKTVEDEDAEELDREIVTPLLVSDEILVP